MGPAPVLGVFDALNITNDWYWMVISRTQTVQWDSDHLGYACAGIAVQRGRAAGAELSAK
jgi:hypothetical protein